MLLCDIASLSRLSITIFSLTGKPLLQIGLYHSEQYATGKTEGVSLEAAVPANHLTVIHCELDTL